MQETSESSLVSEFKDRVQKILERFKKKAIGNDLIILEQVESILVGPLAGDRDRLFEAILQKLNSLSVKEGADDLVEEIEKLRPEQKVAQGLMAKKQEFEIKTEALRDCSEEIGRFTHLIDEKKRVCLVTFTEKKDEMLKRNFWLWERARVESLKSEKDVEKMAQTGLYRFSVFRNFFDSAYQARLKKYQTYVDVSDRVSTLSKDLDDVCQGKKFGVEETSGEKYEALSEYLSYVNKIEKTLGHEVSDIFQGTVRFLKSKVTQKSALEIQKGQLSQKIDELQSEISRLSSSVSSQKQADAPSSTETARASL